MQPNVKHEKKTMGKGNKPREKDLKDVVGYDLLYAPSNFRFYIK